MRRRGEYDGRRPRQGIQQVHDRTGTPRGDLARLEVRTAERDRALDLLDRVECLVARIGGFMTPADQDTMREVRAALVESGKRVDVRPLWTDRR